MAEPARRALLIATTNYLEELPLKSPVNDAGRLKSILTNPEIADFTVDEVLNKPSHEQLIAIEEFFSAGNSTDVLLLHISCHGKRDLAGRLHYVASNTLERRLASTAVSHRYLQDQLDSCRAGQIYVFLDCCHSGAALDGSKGASEKAGSLIGLSAKGRAVITSTDSLTRSWESEAGKIAGLNRSTSYFTDALIRGIETGAADLDGDGLIGINELFEYISGEVKSANPQQTPQFSNKIFAGRMHFAVSPKVKGSDKQDKGPRSPNRQSKSALTQPSGNAPRIEPPRAKAVRSDTPLDKQGPQSRTQDTPRTLPPTPARAPARETTDRPTPPEFKPPAATRRTQALSAPASRDEPERPPESAARKGPSSNKSEPSRSNTTQKAAARRRDKRVLTFGGIAIATVLPASAFGYLVQQIAAAGTSSADGTPSTALELFSSAFGYYFALGSASVLILCCLFLAIPPWGESRGLRALGGAVLGTALLLLTINIAPAQLAQIEAELAVERATTPFPIEDEIDSDQLCSQASSLKVGDTWWSAALIKSTKSQACTTLDLYQGWNKVASVPLTINSDAHYSGATLFAFAGPSLETSFLVARVGGGVTGVPLANPAAPWSMELDNAAQYPKLFEDKLLVPRNDPEALRAFNGTTGELLWTAGCPTRRTWQSTVVNELPPSIYCSAGGDRAIYQVSPSGELTRTS